MADTKQLTLPITGMTCANCVATVERNLKKLEGVQSAVVNLSSERATVDFEPAKLQLTDVIARVNRAGYGVATGEADLVIKRLSDDNDARRLEKALSGLEGVLEAQVNYTTEKARVKYIPTIVTQAELRRAVAGVGFEAVELGGEAEDAEAIARVAMAIENPGGLQAVNLKVAEKYVEAFSGLAKAGNTLIVPYNMADISSLIAGAMSVVKSQAPERTGQA